MITSDVTNSPIAAAATIAMSIDSSMLILRFRMSSQASVRMGQQPMPSPSPATHELVRPDIVSAAQKATTRVRSRYVRSTRAHRLLPEPVVRGGHFLS